MSTDRVMLLIDADNVSVDVMEQAVAKLLADYGALHVRRAYGTAESTVQHQAAFKRLSIKPMVNLAAGKNSTDIALAVDALDLVLAERPDVVVIASSDSDFAPLVSRLREKGCRVRGIGQAGKTGAETPLVYDAYDEFEHRAARAQAPDATAKRARGARAGVTRGATVGVAKNAGPSAAVKTASAKSVPVKKVATKKIAAKVAQTAAAAPRKSRAKASAADAMAPGMPLPMPAPTVPAQIAAIFRALPQLAQGSVELSRASEVLRREHLLSNRSTSRKLFEHHPDWFELTPHDKPTRVTARQTPAT